MSALVTLDRSTAGQIRIVLRESKGGGVGFLVFVGIVAVGLYLLMPAARNAPGPLVGLLAVAVGWAGFAMSAREEYIVDRDSRTVRARYWSLLGLREDQVKGEEIAAVRLGIGGPDDDRLLVELLEARGKVRLRLPRRVNTFSSSDQKTVGRLLAESLSLPVVS
jgi:hypothetical protein